MPLAAIVITTAIGCATLGDLTFDGRSFWADPVEPSSKADAMAHYMAAVILERRGNREAALEQLKRVPELDPEAITPTLQLVRAYLRQGDFENALVMCERAIEAAPTRANLWIVLGEIYHQLDRYPQAIRAFEQAIALNPDNITSYSALVELQESTNDLVAAVEIYERLVELNPRSAGLYYQLGINLARIDDNDGAEAALTKALELEPNITQARFLLGAVYLEAGQNEAAAAELEIVLEKLPRDVRARENLAGAFARLGRLDEALELYQAILTSQAADTRHFLDAMYMHLRNGQPEAVEEVLPPSNAPILGTIMTAIARQDRSLPTRPLVESLDNIDGDIDMETSAYIGSLLYLFDERIAGDWLIDRIDGLRIADSPSRTLDIVLARTYMTLDRHGDAAMLFENVIDRYGSSTYLHEYLAICYEALDNFAKTEEHLRAFLRLDPGNPDMLNFLGYLYAEHAVKLDEAENLLEEALQSDPENPFYLDSLGWVYYQRGDADRAIELIQRAIYGMETDDAVLRDHLGDAFFLKGDVDRAIDEWRRAHRLDPSLEGVGEKLQMHAIEKERDAVEI